MLRTRHLTDVVLLLTVLAAQIRLYSYLAQHPRFPHSPRGRRGAALLLAAVCGAVIFCVLLSYHRVSRHFSLPFVHWTQGVMLVWGLFSVGLVAVLWLWRRVPEPVMERRRFLRAARTATLALPAVVTGYGVFIQRTRLHLREVDIAVPRLPPDLHGLRLVQLTDIHLSPWLTVRELEWAVALANETRAQVALVTGDLITRLGDPLDACLDRLAHLRADAGVLGCMGNHEIYAQAQCYTKREGARHGLDFLRGEARSLRFGDANLHVAGVDYQKVREAYLVDAERLVCPEPQTLNVLLSHNPDVFPVAARQGFGLTVAGHTHGGQITVEIVDQWANAARFFTPYVKGLYREGDASVYVSQGIGTVGLPARIGTRPEVTLLRLCATSS